MSQGQANLLGHPQLTDYTFFVCGTVVWLTSTTSFHSKDTTQTRKRPGRAGWKKLCGTHCTVGGFVRKSHYSTAGRVNSPRVGRQMDRALLQTVQTNPQRAQQNKDIHAGPKNGSGRQ